MDKVSSIDRKILFAKFEVSANSDYQNSTLLPIGSYFCQKFLKKNSLQEYLKQKILTS